VCVCVRERERRHLLGAGHGSEHEGGAEPRVFEVRVGVRMDQHLPFVCVRERDIERDRERVCVCVFVCERERQTERQRE